MSRLNGTWYGRCRASVASGGVRSSVFDCERISQRARGHEHNVEREQEFEPGSGFDDWPTTQKLRRRLRRADHDRNEKRKRQHREQQLCESRVHHHSTEVRANRHQTDCGEQRDRDQRRRNLAERQVVEIIRAGMAIRCTAATKMRFAIALPRKIASLLTGDERRPSMAWSAASTPNDRCNPSKPENVKTTQGTPGARSVAATAVGSHP